MTNNLKKLREQAGLSQSQLAEKSSMSVRTIQAYEQYARELQSEEHINAICTALDCEEWNLFQVPSEVSTVMPEIEDYNTSISDLTLKNVCEIYDFTNEYRIITGENIELIEMIEQFIVIPHGNGTDLEQLGVDYGKQLLPFKKWIEWKNPEWEEDYDGDAQEAYQCQADVYLQSLLKVISAFTVIREDDEGTIYIWEEKLKENACSYLYQTADSDGNYWCPDFKKILEK